MIYVMLGWGLNIVVGLAGLLDLGYVAFYAVGAYSYALLSTTFGLSFWICLPLAGVLAAMWGVILGFPVLRLARRLSGDRDAGLRRNHPARADQLGRLHQRLRGHLGHPARHLLRHSVQRRGQRLCGDLPSALFADLPHDVPVLPHPGARAAHQLRHAEAPPPADRPRLGGSARGRNRLPLARHQHHQHQAHRLCARRDVRRFRRLVLFGSPGLRQPGELHLHGIGDHPRHRGARRHGLAARRRDRGRGDDRRARTDARARLDEADFRRRISIRPSTACCCSAPRWSS